MNRFPYLAVDIETTGLDRNKSHVLQLAAIYDDGSNRPVDQLEQFSVQIDWPVIHHAERGAMRMNHTMLAPDYLDVAVPTTIVDPFEARQRWNDFLAGLREKYAIEGRMTLAGKNVGGFDAPILGNDINRFNMSAFKHRNMDPGSMYARYFDEIPSLDQIATMIGQPAVDHTALGDCKLVVEAIRWERLNG